MSEPWFDVNSWGWLPGTLLGVVGGLWGSLLGLLAPRGKGKTLITFSYFAMLAAGAALTVAGIAGCISGQPWLVWYALLLPGAITLLVVGPLGFVARMRFRHAELQKMQAQEFE